MATADLASAGIAGGESSRAQRPQTVDTGQPVAPARERVAPASTEHIAAPQTRVEPGDVRDSTAPAAPAAAAKEGHGWSHMPAASPAPAAPPPSPAPVASADIAGAGNAGQAAAREESTPLFAAGEAQRFRDHWDEIQTGFVDDPRRAVEQADHLVTEVVKRMAEFFAVERAKLERQRSKGGDVSTENLRITLRRYRSFYARLLSL